MYPHVVPGTAWRWMRRRKWTSGPWSPLLPFHDWLEGPFVLAMFHFGYLWLCSWWPWLRGCSCSVFTINSAIDNQQSPNHCVCKKNSIWLGECESANWCWTFSLNMWECNTHDSSCTPVKLRLLSRPRLHMWTWISLLGSVPFPELSKPGDTPHAPLTSTLIPVTNLICHICYIWFHFHNWGFRWIGFPHAWLQQWNSLNLNGQIWEHGSI